MPSEFESAFREMIRAIVKEVVAETNSLGRDDRSIQSEHENQAFLLNSREAAQALSISEPHLSRLTRSGVIPHLRVGKCLRYSVEALENWIRQSESTESLPPRTITTKNLEKPKPVKKATPTISKASNKLQTEKSPNPAEAKKQQKKAVTAPSPKTRQAKPNAKQVTDDQNQRNPFAELLAEIGIDRRSLPSITNGELMRISETEIGTYHGWMYLNRPLPDEAREKLKKHFLGVVSSNSKS